MNCAKIRRWLSAYHDAELPANRRAMVRRHLRQCPHCRAILDDYQALTGVGLLLENAMPPARLWRSLASSLGALREENAPTATEFVAAAAVSAAAGRVYKPVVESLEDRFFMTEMLGALTLACAPITFAPAFPAATCRHDWSRANDVAAEVAGWCCGEAARWHSGDVSAALQLVDAVEYRQITDSEVFATLPTR